MCRMSSRLHSTGGIYSPRAHPLSAPLTVAVILIPGVLLQRVGHGKRLPRSSYTQRQVFPAASTSVPAGATPGATVSAPPAPAGRRLRDMPLPVIHIAPFAALRVVIPSNSRSSSLQRNVVTCPVRPGTPSPDSAHPTGDNVCAQSVRHAQPALRQVPRQPVLLPLSVWCPVTRHAASSGPSYRPTGNNTLRRPAGGAASCSGFVVSKLTQQVPRAVVHAVQVPASS